VESSCECGNEPPGSIKCLETIKWLHCWWPLERYSAPHSWLGSQCTHSERSGWRRGKRQNHSPTSLVPSWKRFTYFRDASLESVWTFQSTHFPTYGIETSIISTNLMERDEQKNPKQCFLYSLPTWAWRSLSGNGMLYQQNAHLALFSCYMPQTSIRNSGQAPEYLLNYMHNTSVTTCGPTAKQQPSLGESSVDSIRGQETRNNGKDVVCVIIPGTMLHNEEWQLSCCRRVEAGSNISTWDLWSMGGNQSLGAWLWSSDPGRYNYEDLDLPVRESRIWSSKMPWAPRD
jgi:hypothetical protein